MPVSRRSSFKGKRKPASLGDEGRDNPRDNPPLSKNLFWPRGRTVGGRVALNSHPPLLLARSWLRWVILERVSVHFGMSNQLR